MFRAIKRRTFRVGNLHVVAAINDIAIGKTLFRDPDNPVRIRERS